MGWCHEFGVEICSECAEPMVADVSSCRCPACGTVCTGRFAGCAAVWARGPVPVAPSRRPLAPGSAPPAEPDIDRHEHERRDGAGAPAVEQLAGRVGAAVDRLEASAGAFEAMRARLDEVAAELAALRAEVERAGVHADEGRARLDELAVRLDGLGPRPDAEARLAALADALPHRLGAAIAAALEAGRDPQVAELCVRLDLLLRSLEQGSPSVPVVSEAAHSRSQHPAAR